MCVAVWDVAVGCGVPVGVAGCVVGCCSEFRSVFTRRPSSKVISVELCCSVLQCVAVCCTVLQCVAVCCNVLQCLEMRFNELQCFAVCCTDRKKSADSEDHPS